MLMLMEDDADEDDLPPVVPVASGSVDFPRRPRKTLERDSKTTPRDAARSGVRTHARMSMNTATTATMLPTMMTIRSVSERDGEGGGGGGGDGGD